LTWAVGQKVTAARLNRRLPVTAAKLGNTSIAGSLSVAADPDLVLTLKANTTYDIHGLLLVTSAADNTGDFRRGWSWTNTATVTVGGAGGVNTITTGTSGSGEWVAKDPDSTSPSEQNVTYLASTTPSGVTVNDRIVVSTSDVTLTLTWAQATASGTTTLRAGSFITATPVD
jgi:hypothetical protein